MLAVLTPRVAAKLPGAVASIASRGVEIVFTPCFIQQRQKFQEI